MRLHRLEVESFGPFASREVIDFDSLAEQGLFLLHGQTGAGKTSLLDAVCFALYGSVPGPRAKTERLTSDHAAHGSSPRVVCEFSAAGRRFEVSRTPAWDRPKSRGSGTVRQQASVLVRELVDGSWVHRADRLDEAGLLLADVLGMAKDQFTKVVLLPQGDFAAFLRAGADDRRKLLEKLFGTARFTWVEDWLADARNTARQELGVAETERGELLARADEHARVLTGYDPEQLSGLTALPPARADDEAARLVVRWRQAAVSQTELALARAGEAAAALAAARRHADDTADRLAAVRRLQGLLRRQRQLLGDLPSHRRAAERCDRAEKAERIRPQLHSLDEGRNGLTSCERELTLARDTVAAISPLVPPATPTSPARTPSPAPSSRASRPRGAVALSSDQLSLDLDDLGFLLGDLVLEPAQQTDRSQTCGLDLGAEIEARHALTGRLEALLAEEQNLTADEQAIGDRLARIATLDGEIASLATSLAGQREKAELLSEQAVRCTALAGTLVDRRQSQLAAHDRAVAATRAAALATQLSAATDTHQQAADAELTARAAYLELVERRLNGMAAELASQLVDGDCCPVCGALEHPEPARAAELVSAAEVDAARRRAEDAQQLAAAAAARRNDLAAEHSAAGAASSGLPPEAAAEALAEARTALAEAESAGAELDRLTGESTALAARITEGESRLQDCRTRRAQLETELAQLTERADLIRTRLRSARAGHPTLAARQAKLADEITSMTSLAEALRDRDDTRARLERLTGDLEQLCAENGFDTIDAARAALLPAADRQRMAGELQGHATALATVHELLAQPESLDTAKNAGLLGDAAWPYADTERTGAGLEVLAAHLDRLATRDTSARDRLRTAEEHAAQASQDHVQLSRSAGALGTIAGQLGALVASVAPLRERFEVLDELANTAHGLSGSNLRRLRLSAFVLEARLEQVAQAASQRLQVMSDGRYTLLHSQSRGKGGGRSGLGLRVMDAWTSIERDTASLSGGESFLASLALALGLADVVQAESGGISFETLFIDEGFGTLDEETLELVMEVLDQLREGGRAVGVVSHVGELRSRIPAQLQVVKGQRGSTVRQVEAALAS